MGHPAGAVPGPLRASLDCECDRRHLAGGRLGTGVVLPGGSRGLQAVRVKTKVGWLCLASDASHFYENFMARKPFPIVVDLQDAFKGYDKIQSLATEKSLVIPGHDPLISRIFPRHERCDFVWRLDVGEREKFQTLTANYT